MRKFLLYICCFPIFGFGQEIVNGYITDRENNPIESAKVFFQNVEGLKSVSDKSGYFEIDYSGYDISGFKFIVFKEGYKFVSIPSKKLKSPMVVTLEPIEEKKEDKPIFEDDVVELDEGVIYSSFAVDSLKKINSILDNVKLKFNANYPSINTTYSISGYHSLTEKRNEEREDTLLYLRSPLFLELTAYNDANIHLNSSIGLQPVSTLFVKNSNYNAPQESPFFLYEQFTWIDFINKDFINKRRNYNYKIIAEDDQSYQISFHIKKIQKDSWSGNFTVNKSDFAITRLEADLEFNRKNSYTIVSKNQTKNATSIIYFEGAKIVWEFAKPEFGFYRIRKLNSDYRIIHIGVDPVYTPQFLVSTKFDFEDKLFPEEIRILPLNELLYRAFIRNYSEISD